MDFSSLIESLQDTLGQFLPKLLLALAILVAGWFVAIILRAAIRRALGLVKLNDKVRSTAGSKMDIEGGIAKGAYYLVLVLTLVGFFNQLDLPLVSAPLQSMVQKVLDHVPNLIAGGVLIFVAWIIATLLRRFSTRALATTQLDEKLSAEAGMPRISESVGNVLYGLVLLLFLPAILGALGLEGLLGPVQRMVDKILTMLPNIFAGALLGMVGWFVARLLRDLVTNLLEAAGADKLGGRAGLQGNLTLSKLVGLIVFIFVFVPALIAALNALKIEAISAPATGMLGILLAAVPNLFAAALILALAIFIARLVSELTSKLLGGIGFDRLPGNLGVANVFPENTSPSVFAGKVVAFFILLFASVEAASVLGFEQVSGIVTMFINFGGEVFLGLVIIAVGLWISNLAHGAIKRLDRPNADFMAGLARLTILGIVFAMGLRAMGIADDIVNLAFGLTLGAVAVAVALSFGLGGREAAGKQMEHWFRRLRK